MYLLRGMNHHVPILTYLDHTMIKPLPSYAPPTWHYAASGPYGHHGRRRGGGCPKMDPSKSLPSHKKPWPTVDGPAKSESPVGR